MRRSIKSLTLPFYGDSQKYQTSRSITITRMQSYEPKHLVNGTKLLSWKNCIDYGDNGCTIMIKLTTEKIIKIHGIFMEMDKGTDEYSLGVRDIGTLDNFVCFQFDNNNHVFKNAAFALYSITHRHAFYNANKRTGFGIASMILESERYFVNAKKQEKFEYLLKIAQYETTVEEIEDWFVSNTRQMGKLQFKLYYTKKEVISILSLIVKKLKTTKKKKIKI